MAFDFISLIWLMIGFALGLIVSVAYVVLGRFVTVLDVTADEALRGRAALAVGWMVGVWIAFALSNLMRTPDRISALDLIPVLYAVYVVLFVVWTVGSQQSLRANPVHVVIFFVSSVGAHIGFFASAYLWISRVVANSFSGTASPGSLSQAEALYVAVTTFTTVGSGSLYAQGDVARLAVALESLLSFLIYAIGLSLVLRRFSSTSPPSEPKST